MPRLDHFPQEWENIVRRWAARHPRIDQVFLFGSRAKGTNRPDSDVDLAILVGGTDDDEKLAYSICMAEKWRKELAPTLSVQLHLQIAIPEDNSIVRQAIRDHGQLIYRAKTDP